mmetsp:Transcript_37968/g.89129  ORF Transcript_37968/g.89129 Transcript_37968/m.89129 type:complete len:230 (+) Transcript_37968:50-739(+)
MNRLWANVDSSLEQRRGIPISGAAGTLTIPKSHGEGPSQTYSSVLPRELLRGNSSSNREGVGSGSGGSEVSVSGSGWGSSWRMQRKSLRESPGPTSQPSSANMSSGSSSRSRGFTLAQVRMRRSEFTVMRISPMANLSKAWMHARSAAESCHGPSIQDRTPSWVSRRSTTAKASLQPRTPEPSQLIAGSTQSRAFISCRTSSWLGMGLENFSILCTAAQMDCSVSGPPH